MRLFKYFISLIPALALTLSAEPETAFRFSDSDFADRIAVLTCSSKSEQWFGSGFVAELDGKHYIFTNQDVILGADRISCKTVDGTPLRPRKVELSNVRNLARLEVEADTGFILSSSAKMDDPVAVFGNEEGESTGYFGSINGVGADLIEITAEFTRENGGAPVLNTDGDVIGMASHVRESRGHAMKEGTKFEDRTRRFCQRFNNIGWQTVNWKRFNADFGKPYRQNEQIIESTYDILIGWQDEPFSTLSLKHGSDRNFSSWVNEHNTVMKKYSGSANRRAKYSAYTESLEALSDVCDARARKLHLLEERRELTGFLRNEFSAQASAFEYATKYIKRRGDTIHTHGD